MAAVFVKDGKTIERSKCEIYTRVMWYHRPVSFYNLWKKSEFYSRTYFKWSEANASFNVEHSCGCSC
jgi:hypothetical protein